MAQDRAKEGVRLPYVLRHFDVSYLGICAPHVWICCVAHRAGLDFGGVRSLSLLETPGALDVALMPGVCFGQAGEGWVRISLLKHAAELFQVVAHVDRVLRSA